ncbi:hypothetical protein SK128_024421 [Halocaridina rubra]|uniref:GST C-terminal domain-containing protein n=1 Tax=Halocaridina rubra TaxID=373956 RepID=A0AAN8X5A5_HALRR
MEKKLIADTAKYLGAAKVKVTADKNGKVLVEAGGEKTSGFVCGILTLVRSQNTSLEGSTPLQKCLTLDWLTYFATHLFHCSTHEALNSCLQHIDRELLSRTYLCCHRLTVADIVLFMALHPFITNWSFMQKEQYMNISRWCSSMQNDVVLKKTYKPIKFSRTCLYEGALCH